MCIIHTRYAPQTSCMLFLPVHRLVVDGLPFKMKGKFFLVEKICMIHRDAFRNTVVGYNHVVRIPL